jgi:hypothetical protein
LPPVIDEPAVPTALDVGFPLGITVAALDVPEERVPARFAGVAGIVVVIGPLPTAFVDTAGAVVDTPVPVTDTFVV